MTAAAGTRTEKSDAVRKTATRYVLAIDYGRKRMGLAVAEEAGGVPRPLATIERKNRREDLRRLREIVREHGVKRIVVGLPLRLDGTRGEMAEETERFVERLRKQIGVPVELVDERLTSWEAEQILTEREGSRNRQDVEHAEKGRKKPRGHDVDALAAAVILREYLERKKKQGQP